MKKAQLPKEYDGKKLQTETFLNPFEEFEYVEWMVDAFYELKPEYQKLVHIYQDFGKTLKIEEYMFNKKEKKTEDSCFYEKKWTEGDDLPF